MENNLKRIVLTGGPCTGKTTTANLLSVMGNYVVSEAARQILAEQDKILPWTDMKGFQKLVVQRQLQMENSAPAKAYCDRGIIDNLAYCAIAGIRPPKEIYEVNPNTRYTQIFLLDPLPFATDAERYESAEEQLFIHNTIESAYKMHGYELEKVPVLPPQERVEYILERCQ